METKETYKCRIFNVLKEKDNFGGDFSKMVRSAPWSEMKRFCEELNGDDYVGKLAIYGMNNGFDKKVKSCLDDLLAVYKLAHGKNAKVTDTQNKYAEIKKKIRDINVSNPQFLFKDILFNHIDFAISKTDVLSDEGLEMFVPGLDERMADSKQAFLALKTALDEVLDWSSESAFSQAKTVFQKIRVWNNVKVVSCVTSMHLIETEEVLKPIKEAEAIVKDWSNATHGVGKNNPRVKADVLKELDFQDDQLKVWIASRKNKKSK